MKYIALSISLLSSYLYTMELNNTVLVDSKKIKNQGTAQVLSEEELSLFVLRNKRLNNNKLHNGYAIYGCMNLPEQNITTKQKSGIVHVNLDCSFKNLDYINTYPHFQFLHVPALGTLLTSADFSYNKIRTLHLGTLLDQCPHLTSLHVTNNKIEQIHCGGGDDFLKNYKLEYLDISHNRIDNKDSITPILHVCGGLSYLNIKKNKFSEQNKSYLLSHIAGYFSVPGYKKSETIQGNTARIFYKSDAIKHKPVFTLLLTYDKEVLR